MERDIENKKYNDMVEYLKEHIDVLGVLAYDCNSYDGSLEDFIWYDHNEDFYEIYFTEKVDIARAVYYSGNDYRYTDPYIRVNVYGNLETCCDYEREKYLEDYVEEILDTWLDLYGDNNVDTYDNTLKELIRCFYDTESEDDE